eukprot:SAG11_NODE_37151_length_258_cov_0.654088_1_plen_64_part_01
MVLLQEIYSCTVLPSYFSSPAGMRWPRWHAAACLKAYLSEFRRGRILLILSEFVVLILGTIYML